MASSWARSLPVVTVPNGTEPKCVTLVVPYYESPQFLGRQIWVWGSYDQHLREFLTVIVVDDGSPQPLVVPEWRGFSMRLFRIEQDIKWNWLAARNIGAHHAKTAWLMLTDMDHVVPEETLRSVVYGQHDPSVIYAFSRREHTGACVSPHSASFLMTREMFWKIGGYDEALSGSYGTDGEYRRRAALVAPIHVLTDELIRHEYVDDSSTMRYKRKQPEDYACVQQLIRQRKPGWRPKVLSFPYHEVQVTL